LRRDMRPRYPVSNIPRPDKIPTALNIVVCDDETSLKSLEGPDPCCSPPSVDGGLASLARLYRTR
jgi:hypothetical protein